MATTAKIGTDPIFKWGLSLFLLVAAPAWAFDAGGAALGDAEAAVMKAYPEAHCQPMEWKTDAADRRCDASPARLGGVEARITFYLRRNAVQAFDVRFDTAGLEALVAFLRKRYGVPDVDRVQTFERRRGTWQVRKLRWKRGADQAVLSAQVGGRRGELNVWRGNFDAEVYRMR